MSASSISDTTFTFLRKKLKFFLAICIFLALIIFGTLIYHSFFCADKQFETLCNDLFEEFFPSDALSLAFTFSDPPETETLLPIYDKADYLNSAGGNDYLIRLEKIDPERLCDEYAVLYHIMTDYLTRHQKDSDFLYMEEPLSPTGGVQTNLPVLLAEYPVENQEDIEKYLDILEAIPDYLESLGEYETDKKEAGYLMPTDDLNEVITQCDDMRSENGYLLFTEGFSSLLSRVEGLSDSQKKQYTAECERIVTTLIFPAYEALGDTLLVLREENVQRQGLSEKGQSDYYAHLLSLKTGSDKSVTEIEKMLQSRFEILAGEFNTLLPLIKTNPPGDNFTIIQDEPNNLLFYLEDTLQKYFPALPNEVNTSIHNVPDCLLPYTAPAYYFTPRVDDYLDNAIYINKTDITDELSLFTTLAHEGYPGHMLQSTYFLSHEEKKRQDLHGLLPLEKQNALRTAFNYIGYIEGWAMYVELFSYDYAAPTDQMQDDMVKTYCKMLRVDRELKICLYCLLDIRVNYYGDCAECIAPYLKNVGITEDAAIQAVYNYLINEPATYASYYVGFLELLECKELYENYCDQSGISFTEKDFHTFYLDCGPSGFSHIKWMMERHFLQK